jgi:hypothetical protein
MQNAGLTACRKIFSKTMTLVEPRCIMFPKDLEMNVYNTNDELVKQFRDSKMAHVQGIQNGDVEATEKGARGYINAAEALLKLKTGTETFAALLSDENRDVRTAAAHYLLRHKTDKALSVLRDSARGKDLAAFGALATLARWEHGGKGFWEEIARIAHDSRAPDGGNK